MSENLTVRATPTARIVEERVARGIITWTLDDKSNWFVSKSDDPEKLTWISATDVPTYVRRAAQRA